MKKKIIIGIVVVIVLVIGWLLVNIWLGSGGQQAVQTSTSSQTSSSFDTAYVPPVPPGDTIAIGTPHGTVTVKNFYKTITASEEEYLIFQKTAAYEYLYDPNNGSFVISIIAGSLMVVEPQAETGFLSALSVSKTDACKLNVIVGIGSSALPLSFCGASGVIQ
jgi:hypothetical protein